MNWDAATLAGEIAALITLDTDRRDEGMMAVKKGGDGTVLLVAVDDKTFLVTVEEVK